MRFTLRWQGFECFFLTFLVWDLCREKDILHDIVQLALDLTVSDKTPPETVTHSIWFHHPRHMADILLPNMAAPIGDITFMFHNQKGVKGMEKAHTFFYSEILEVEYRFCLRLILQTLFYLGARDPGKRGENQKFFATENGENGYWKETSSFFHRVLSLVSNKKQIRS